MADLKAAGCCDGYATGGAHNYMYISYMALCVHPYIHVFPRRTECRRLALLNTNIEYSRKSPLNLVRAD